MATAPCQPGCRSVLCLGLELRASVVPPDRPGTPLERQPHRLEPNNLLDCGQKRAEAEVVVAEARHDAERVRHAAEERTAAPTAAA